MTSRSRMWIDPLVFGLTGFICALIVALTFFLPNEADDYAYALTLTAPIGCIWMAFLLWHRFYQKKPTLTRAIVVGLLINTLAHPVMWYLYLLYTYYTNQIGDLSGVGLGPFRAIPMAFIYSFYSIILVGWLTALIGALTGVLLHKIGQRGKNNSISA